MATLAFKFTAVTDAIAMTSSVSFAGAYMIGHHYAVMFDAGSTSLGSGEYRLLGSSGSAGNGFFFSLYAGNAAGFGGGSPTTKYFYIQFQNVSGAYQEFRTTFDPFAGMAGDGLWHYVSVDWNGYTGVCTLIIDGISYKSNDPLSGFVSLTLIPMTSFLSLSDGLYIGGDNHSMVGMAVANIGYWGLQSTTTGGTTIFDYSGTPNDPEAFANGVPAEVIATDTRFDVINISGVGSTPGVYGKLTATFAGTTTVAGPPLGPPNAVIAQTRFNGVGHTPGSVTVDFWWQDSSPLIGGVALICTPSIGSMVVSPVTLTDGPSDKVSAILNIPSLTTLGDYSIEVTNSQGIRQLSIPVHVANPAVKVSRVELMSNGNGVAFFAEMLDGTPVSVERMYMTGSKVTLNPLSGGVQKPMDGLIPAFTGVGGLTFGWTLLKNQNVTQYRDNSQSTKTLPETWHTTTAQTGSYWNFGFGVSGNGVLGYSSDPGATSTDTFAVIPGRLYGVYRPLNDCTLNLSSSRSAIGTATSQARRTITDGVTSAHYDEDQMVEGPYDACRQLYRLSLVGKIRPVSDTITITLSNQAGTNYLYNNGHILILQEEAYSVNGDRVDFDLPDNFISTAYGTTGPVTLTGIRMTPQTQAPLNLSLRHDMAHGYNMKYPNGNAGFGKVYANLTKHSDGWNGGPRDGNSQLTGIAPGETLNISHIGDGSFVFSSGNTHDVRGDIGTFGPRKAVFNIPTGGNPTVRFSLGGIDNGDHTTDYNGGSSPVVSVEFEQTPDAAFWAKPIGYNKNYSLECKSNGSVLDYIYNLKVLDDLTPFNWPHTMHPTNHGRLNGRFPGGTLRWVITMGILASNNHLWTHQYSSDNMTYRSNVGSVDLGAPIVAIDPVAPGFETDLANAIWYYVQGAMYVKVTTGTPHGLVTENYIPGAANWIGIDWTGHADTNGGTTNIGSSKVAKIDDTSFIALIGSTATSMPNFPNTLAAPMTIAPGARLEMLVSGMPYSDAIDMTHEVFMRPWLQLPSMAQDSYANNLGQCFVSRSNPGDYFYLEYSNERWNIGYELSANFELYHENHFYWDSTGHAKGYLCDTFQEWGHLRTYQLGAQCIAGVTGIPEIRVEGYGAGATGTAVLSAGGVLSITITNGGTGYTSVPTVHVLGGSGTGATATATIDGSGHVIGFVMTNPGTGYIPTGRSADDVRICYSGFNLDGVTLQALATAAHRHNFPIKYVMPVAFYVNNEALGSYSVMDGGLLNSLYDQASEGDLNDIWAYHTRYNDYSSLTTAIVSYLEGQGFADISLVSYETATVDMCPHGDTSDGGNERRRRNQTALAHSTMYHTHKFFMQECEYRYGFELMNYFTLDDGTGMAGNSMWHTFLSPVQQVGTGNPSENARLHDIRDQYSQIGGAHKDYVAYVPPSITPVESSPMSAAALAALC